MKELIALETLHGTYKNEEPNEPSACKEQQTNPQKKTACTSSQSNFSIENSFRFVYFLFRFNT
ncbi:hypothetical protein Fmac_004478 [Flemingia macrophylla]|uniref:Uncharacterized protein n=1 Tax=Flemingia macrophylla TaxID=520843 RepID=A0ABD1N595_9FABA